MYQNLCVLSLCLIAVHMCDTDGLTRSRFARSIPNVHHQRPQSPHHPNEHDTSVSDPVAFACPFSQVILVEQFTDNEIKVGCGQMPICNEQRTCSLNPFAGLCTGKANYLSEIKEKVHDGDLSGHCCQYSPPVKSHVNDNCQVFTINNLMPHRPMSIQTTLVPHRHIQGQSSAGKVHMSLFIPLPHPPPVQVVKGIQKTATGYAITFCTLQCDQTTTTIQPTTVKAVTVPAQPVPPPAQVAGGPPNSGAAAAAAAAGAGAAGQGAGGASSKSSSSSSSSSGGSSQSQSRLVVHSNSVAHSAASANSAAASSGTANQNAAPATSQNAPGGGSHEVHHAHHGHGHGQGSGGGGGWGGCFSSEMTTQTKFGLKRMDELQIGDEVLVARSDQIESYQPIEWFYHQNKDTETTFVTIRTEFNRTLSLTPNHLLTFVPCLPKRIELSDLEEYINYDSLFSEKAKPGMCLATKRGDHFETDLIQFVFTGTKKGVFSPITTQGTIIVNDIQASCYSTVEHHYLQYGMHKSLLHIRGLLNPVLKYFSRPIEKTNVQNEVPFVLRFIGEIAELVVPSIMYK